MVISLNIQTILDINLNDDTMKTHFPNNIYTKITFKNHSVNLTLFFSQKKNINFHSSYKVLGFIIRLSLFTPLTYLFYVI